MNRTHLILAIIIAILAPALVMAQDADVVYLEGFPTLRSGGAARDLDFGLVIRPGDSVVTGRRDFAELDQAGNSIRINSDTVFTVREIERDGRRETVLTNTVGSVAYRFQTLAGRQQQVGTATTVAGVRGTEFTVYAGSDGSSLFAVDEGLVAVESAGVEVELAAGQAVEVRAGEAPGAVFEWLGRELDFSTWNQQQTDNFLADPVAGARRIQERLRFFQDQIDVLWPLYLEARAQLDAAREQMNRIRDTQGMEQAQAFARENVNPLIGPAGTLTLNTRYFALSALSLRRFVLGTMYVDLKTRNITNLSNSQFLEFLGVREEIMAEFESIVVPRLNENDI